jgi:hypothetical protein
MRIIAAALAIYAVYLPVAMFVHRDYVQLPRPSGKAFEKILRFSVDPPRYAARSYVFAPAQYPDTSQIRVYEDMLPLPTANVDLVTIADTYYLVRIITSDGSDPRTNGRQYWTVAP